MRQCTKLGILCAKWDSRRLLDAAAVVLVTPELAVGEEFATFLNQLRATRQLDRIVIDECHIVLNRRYDFRKDMQKLGKLAAAKTQIAAKRGGRVISASVRQARLGRVIPGRNREDEHSVPGS
jgi:hypothetical protein